MTRIARYLFDAPPRNILTIALLDRMRDDLRHLASEGADAIVWESVNPQLFSAGVDLNEHHVPTVPAMLRAVHGLFRSFIELEAVMVAQVHGPCLGGAAESAFGCDGVIASDDATFAFPEIKVGCFPPLAAATLGARIGQVRARELILSGRIVTAPEALSLGLVNRVVPRAALASETHEFIHGVCDHSSRAVRLATLKLMRRFHHRDWDEALATAESAYRALPHADMEEGIAAFFEKRAPEWPSDPV